MGTIGNVFRINPERKTRSDFEFDLLFLFQIPSEYPPDLQGEISYHLNKEVLDLPLFNGLQSNSLKYLGKGIETQFVGPNEFLIHKDDPLNEIWYISSGSMEVLDSDMVVAILGNYL